MRDLFLYLFRRSLTRTLAIFIDIAINGKLSQITMILIAISGKRGLVSDNNF